MNLVKQNELIHLIGNPYKAVSSDIDKLIELKKQFPFFQSAHMLLTLVSKKYDSSIYQQTLKQTAISIPNRSWLHNLLNAPEITEVVGIKPEEKLTTTQISNQEIETKVEDKVEIVPTEIEHMKAIELSSVEKTEADREQKLNELVEKEVQKDIINAFIEKEVLKTPDWYKKTAQQEKQEVVKAEEKQEETQASLTAGTFSDWLKALKKSDRVVDDTDTNKINQDKQIEKKEVEKKEEKIISTQENSEKKAKQQAIIDKIIEVNPTTIRLDPNQRFFAADVKAKESLIENEDLVTETLAKIYALQGNISKAVRAYEILSLKFPQKSAYFATLIQNLKKQNQ